MKTRTTSGDDFLGGLRFLSCGQIRAWNAAIVLLWCAKQYAALFLPQGSDVESALRRMDQKEISPVVLRSNRTGMVPRMFVKT